MEVLEQALRDSAVAGLIGCDDRAHSLFKSLAYYVIKDGIRATISSFSLWSHSTCIDTQPIDHEARL